MNEPSRALRIGAAPAMLVAGGLIAGQSQINGRLADELGTGARAGFAAAVISFGTGLVVVGAVTAALPRGRAGYRAIRAARRTGRLRPVELIGGALGAFLVATQGITVGTIGVALFTVAVTAGQSASALLVDHLGLGPSGHQAFSTPRAIAAAFAVSAVVLATSERLIDSFDLKIAAFALLPLLAGVGSSVQQALNGRVNAVGGALPTTFNNFAVGTAVLVVALALSLLAPGHLDGLPHTWWLYVGGTMGVVVIGLAAALVRVHGVLVLGLSMIAGQVIGAELIEVLGSSAHVGIVGVVAGALTVAGVLVALLLRPRTTPAQH